MNTDNSEAMRLTEACKHGWLENVDPDKCDLADLLAILRQQSERIAELEAELQATSNKLQDLQSLFDYVRERRAQISHRLWVWAHQELSEPLKTRYFNIVANGTADVMEQPTYAQQYNGQKHRAEAAEAERDRLREEVERLKREKANAIDKAGHMLAAGMGLSNCAFNLKQRVGETLSTHDVAALESSQRAWDAAIDAARTTHKDTP